MAKGPDKRRASALPAMLLLLIYSPVSRAEITLDGTLGPGGSVTGPDYLIPAEAGERVGGNLFHSFGVFDINTNESATFTGPDPIQNVLGRVTGGSQSNIDGTLRSTMSNADVYLINPAGIVFGENAQLDVQGSFHASTTDYVRLGENGHFAASVQPDASTLTVAPPASFGFLDANLAPITVLAGAVNQPLQVPAGETISLVGGDVVVRGSVLFAPSGRINIASVASPGEVRTAGGGLAVDSFAELGDIRLSQGAIVSANDADEGGGSIVIRGGQLVANNSFVFANTFGDLNGHGINIRLAGDLVLSNGGDIRATTSGAGNAGDIVIAADNLTLLAGAQIDSSSGSAGQAGKLTVNAAGSISISGLDRQRFSSGAFSNTFGDGDANDLSISAGHLKMNDGHVTAGSLGSGSGGDVLIQAGQVTLTNTAAVDSTATSAGPGGDVKIVTSDGMRIVGGPLDATDPTGVFNNANSTGAAGDLTIITDGPLVMRGGRILTRTLGDANGGTIAIRARDLKLSNGAQIFSGIGNFDPETDMVVGSPTGDGTGGDLVVTVGDTISLSGVGPDRLQSGLFASAQTGQGDGGDISVSARNLNIADTAMIESATRSDAQGNAGDIVVSVGRLTISSGGSISTESTGNISGDAGGITIKDADVVRLTNGSIDSAAVQSGGGNIVLRAGELVDLVDSRITTSVRAGEGRGGDITIDPRFVVLDDSQIRASADRGRGGDITIVAGQFFQTPDSIVDASSEENIDGTVVIDSPDTDLTGSITRLPASFLNAAALLSERCAARDADEASSFVIVGRGVPRGPEDWALSSYGSYGRSTEAKNAQTGMDKERRSQTPDDGSSPKDSRPTATLENPALAMIKVSCGR